MVVHPLQKSLLVLMGIAFIFSGNVVAQEKIRGMDLTLLGENLRRDHFDLVIYGKGLTAKDLQIELKANPGFGGQWEKAGGEADVYDYKDRLIAIQSFEVKRYLGQDVRENCIAVRLRFHGAEPPAVSAIYAVPASREEGVASLKALAKIVENRPGELKRLSLAAHVRPRPYVLESGSSWTEHVEAPVSQYKPGVREVEWLDILFGDS